MSFGMGFYMFLFCRAALRPRSLLCGQQAYFGSRLNPKPEMPAFRFARVLAWIFCMILTRLIFVSACAALAPSKHEQQAVAAGNSSNSFSNKRTWQDAPNEDSKHASPDTER